MTDAAGDVVEEYRHHPFGHERWEDDTKDAFAVSNRFTGQIYDDDTGLYYYGSRYYDAELGRFIQADSVIPGGPTSGSQALNRYSYTFNNPLKFTDPDGQSPVLDYSVAIFSAINNVGAAGAEAQSYQNGDSVVQDPNNADSGLGPASGNRRVQAEREYRKDRITQIQENHNNVFQNSSNKNGPSALTNTEQQTVQNDPNTITPNKQVSTSLTYIGKKDGTPHYLMSQEQFELLLVDKAHKMIGTNDIEQGEISDSLWEGYTFDTSLHDNSKYRNGVIDYDGKYVGKVTAIVKVAVPSVNPSFPFQSGSVTYTPKKYKIPSRFIGSDANYVGIGIYLHHKGYTKKEALKIIGNYKRTTALSSTRIKNATAFGGLGWDLYDPSRIPNYNPSTGEHIR